MNLFNDMVITALKKQLDASSLRQRVIANNLANLDTPGFKKSTVSFEEQLAKALKRSNSRGTRVNGGIQSNGGTLTDRVRGSSGGPSSAGSDARNTGAVGGSKSASSTYDANASGSMGMASDAKGAGKAPGTAPTPTYLNGVQPQVVCDRWSSARADGNNVDLEEEMVVLTSNAFMYQITAQLISNKYSELSNVIRGGK